jgi:hypothetical protein
MVYIYSHPQDSKRLRYAANHIFGNVLGIDFEIVTEKSVFLVQTCACINYSETDLNHGLWILPHGLLAEKGVRKMTDLQDSEWKGFFCFFRQQKGDIPFDIFAASFYLLTLYGEYFPENLDTHARFDIRESYLYRKGFLEIPVVDRWAYSLKEEILKHYPETPFKLRNYRFLSTFDIDFPYQFLKKGVLKTLGGIVRDLLKGDFQNIKLRLSVLLHLNPDPYFDVIQWIEELHNRASLNCLLFILTNKKGAYGNKTVYPLTSYYQYLNKLNRAETGLHPSYDAYLNLPQLLSEKKDLEENLKNGKEITRSRQHFLRMRVPETFRNLQKAGIKEDFTLIFALSPGFRSGTSIPYYFYDLENDEETPLLLHTTVVMDSTLITHLQLSPEEALFKMKQLIDECEKSGGDYVSLWHNSNLSGKGNVWRKVLVESFEYAITKVRR